MVQMEGLYLQLDRYLLPTIIIFGTIGAIINEILFYFRKQLRTTSCALYFRALSANDLLVLWFVMFPQWLSDQFNINPMLQYDWYCKFSTYLTYVFYTLTPYFIVLACFDRLCTSSTNARLRKIATIRIASILTLCMILFIFAIYSYIPNWSQIIVTNSTDTYCTVIDPNFSKVMAFSLLFFYCLIPPLLMIILCTITFLLLRQQRRRIMPVNQTRLRQRDNQLLKMLFIYVATNIICIFPFTVTYFLEIYKDQNLSPLGDPLVQIFVLLVNVTYSTSFYVYTLGTPFYRDELINLLRTIWHKCRRDQHPFLRRRQTTSEDGV